MPEQALPNKRANPKEQDTQIAAVLRREAEQLLTELVRDCEHIRGDNCCSECGLARVEAFARRQRAQAEDVIRAEVSALYQAFEMESLNGVVCSIPDEGLDTKPHRTWCARCQKRWKRLKAIGEARAAAEGTET